MIRAGIWPIVAVASVVVAAAQTSEEADTTITADRPGFATPPGVLGRGVAEIEGGVTFSVDTAEHTRERTVTLGSPLMRFGVGRSIELRVAGDGFLFRGDESPGHSTAAGWSDLALGAKIAVVHERRNFPAISLLPSIVTPTGDRAFTNSTYDPGLGIAAFKTLPAGLSLTGTITGTSISEERVRHGQSASAIAIWFPAPARSAGYIEMYAVASEGPGGASTRTFDGGFSRNFGPNLQVDIEAGRRMYSGRPCWFVATGFAWRRIPGRS